MPAFEILRDLDKPIGTFECSSCEQTFDGSKLIPSEDDELLQVEENPEIKWRCPSLGCNSPVRKINDHPKLIK